MGEASLLNPLLRKWRFLERFISTLRLFSGCASSVGAKSIRKIFPFLLSNLFHRRNSRHQTRALDISRDRRIRGDEQPDFRSAREKIKWNAFKMLKWSVVERIQERGTPSSEDHWSSTLKLNIEINSNGSSIFFNKNIVRKNIDV